MGRKPAPRKPYKLPHRSQHRLQHRSQHRSHPHGARKTLHRSQHAPIVMKPEDARDLKKTAAIIMAVATAATAVYNADHIDKYVNNIDKVKNIKQAVTNNRSFVGGMGKISSVISKIIRDTHALVKYFVR